MFVDIDMSTSDKRRREILFLRHPFCYWCGRPVKMYVHSQHETPPPDQATLDHIRTRYNPERHMPSDKEQTVLACWECNHKRGEEDTQNMPLEELHNRSKRHGTLEVA